jgi:hypothetical protein
MSSQFIDLNAPSLQGQKRRQPAELPHGLLTPPREIRELVEKERLKHPAEAFALAEQRLLNEWTLQYYFDYLGHEVLYRPTAEGPEVLAVGLAEVLALKKAWSPEEQSLLETYLGY